MKLSNKRQINKKSISIGQTLETNDLYLPHKKSRIPDSKSRPIIVVDKNKNDRYTILHNYYNMLLSNDLMDV